MFPNLVNSGLYDESVIDHRNERPLTIAFVTIVMMMALGIVSVSARQHHHMPESAAPVAASVEK